MTHYSWLVGALLALVLVGAQAYSDFANNTPSLDPGAAAVGQAATATNAQAKNQQNRPLYLMGQPPVAEVAKQQSIEALPETRLNFVLKGVFHSEGKSLGGAVIEVRAGQPSYFSLGQDITEGIRLAELTEHGVILDRNGKREVLLAKDLVKAPIIGAGAATGYTQGAKSEPRKLSKAEQADQNRVQSLRDRLQALRQQAQNN